MREMSAFGCSFRAERKTGQRVEEKNGQRLGRKIQKNRYGTSWEQDTNKWNGAEFVATFSTTLFFTGESQREEGVGNGFLREKPVSKGPSRVQRYLLRPNT